jgi:hypothetical protein
LEQQSSSRLPSLHGFFYRMSMRFITAIWSAVLTAIPLTVSAQDANADLMEATNRVASYWRGIFAACSDGKFPRGALYAEVIAGPMKGGVLQIADPTFQFQTDQIDTTALLNGLQFSATSTLRAMAARYFDRNTGWAAWKRAAEFIVYVRRENGKWVVQGPDGVSYAPPPHTGGPETIFRALPCDKAPKQ